MCGIAGFYGRFPGALLEAMTGRIAHRGPDDTGTWFSADHVVGLGHRRLSIIDLSSGGHQPMIDGSGRYRVVYNGEIYNYADLKRDLERDGARFKSASDTEVLLETFARRGIDGLRTLNGIFAFALHDSVTNELTLVRDGLGVKPLYYAQLAEGLLFASELKALTEYPGLPREVDRDALDCYLTYLWAPAPLTPLRAVRKLEPGEWITVRDGKIVRRGHYFQLPTPAAQPIESEAEAVDALRNALEHSISRQMVADVPVGAFLSGGLDSSTIAYYASRKTSEPLRCYTIDFAAGAGAEGIEQDLPYARRVAKHLGLPLEVIDVGPNIANELPWMVRQLDEPQADPACLNTFYICRRAREDGIKVMLSGAGGDDLLTGYRRHAALRAERYWSWLPRPARGLLSRVARRLPTDRAATRKLGKAFGNAALDGDQRIESYFHWTPRERTQALLGGATAGPLHVNGALAARADLLRPLDRMLFLDQRFFLADHNLAYTDKMSMATGVEVRVPLIDYEMVDVAGRIAPNLKQRGTIGKYVFKKAMESALPLDVIYRPKTGFGVPLRQWIAGPLAPMLQERLSAAALRKHGLFDGAAVSQLLRDNAAGRIDGSYTLLAVLCTELWAEAYL